MRMFARQLNIGKLPHAWVEIEKGTIATAASLDIAFTAADWREVRVILSDFIPASDGVDFYIRTSSDGGATFDSTGGDYQYAASKATAGDVVALESSTSAAQILSDTSQGNAANETLNADIRIIDPSTAAYKSIHYSVDSISSAAGAIRLHVGVGKRLSAADVDGIQFLFPAVNITSGRYKVLGLRE